jgi:hypothetical protein
VVATELLTIAWGLVAIGVASYASLVENLVETGNILGSIFYGSILGLFLVAFFCACSRFGGVLRGASCSVPGADPFLDPKHQLSLVQPDRLCGGAGV